MVSKTTAQKVNRVRVSPRFVAILDCLMEQPARTTPAIAQLCITIDGCLLARHDGDCGYNDFIGSASDLDRNIRGMAEVAGLTDKELAELLAAVPTPGAPA